MRFRQYLNEAIINSDRSKLKAVEKIVVNAKENFDKNGGGGYLDVEDVLSNIVDKIQKLFKDVKFYKSERTDVDALTVPAKDIKNFEIHINFDAKIEAYEALQAQNYKWDIWLRWLMSVFKHELIHVEQLRRISKEKDPETAFGILKGIMLKQKSNSNRMEGYLSNALEIMAHANTAAEELSDVVPPIKDSDSEKKGLKTDYDKLMYTLQTEKGQQYLRRHSRSFRHYYDNIKDNYKKVWKKFLKYLTQYLKKK